MTPNVLTQSPPKPLITAPSRHGVPFARTLASHGERLAIVAPDGTSITYRELAQRVEQMVERLGPARRLVAVEAGNEVDPLVAYLAALAAGHPVLLTTPGGPQLDDMIAAYDPDVVMSRTSTQWSLEERHDQSPHLLHPDLALLMSTSGSTGSAKLVRLSHTNVQSNAEAIVRYLGLTADDRAATTLPMAYCYGLSVINSHLLAGAGLILTDLSVVDQCFWTRFRECGGTGLAGVPHTFDLLERAGFETLDLPELRYVTQAGGRLAPDRVRRFAELGRRCGWQFYVMYGQTEATARMAYLPADEAYANPASIGRPIPGGSFSIDAPNERGEGELVYRGPNVMLGYASGPADLATGRTIDELHTGDIGRVGPTGLYEVVGRASRFVKLFGLRIDLDRVERVLGATGTNAVCAGTDERLVIAVDRGTDVDQVRDEACTRFGLPRGAVEVVPFETLPRLSSGKPDYPAILAAGTSTVTTPSPARRHRTVEGAFAEVFAIDAVPDDATFASLGGDSLSYVEMSSKLEDALGYVPDSWHVTTAGELRALTPRRRRSMRVVETSVVLRAVAIVLVVGSHTGVFTILGAAHVLLAVAGYNFARFRLTDSDRSDHVRSSAASIARIAVPSVVYLGALYLISDRYSLVNLALLNNYLADGTWRYWYWFIEVLVQVLVVLALVFSVPAVRRFERRYPFALPAAVLGGSLLLREITMGDPANQIYRTHAVLWLFVLGWAAQRAGTVWRRVAVSAATVVAVSGFFGTSARDAIVIVGLLALVWVPHVVMPTMVKGIVSAVAAASLYIYLVHWQVYPPLVEMWSPLLAFPLTIAIGLAVAWAVGRCGTLVSRWSGAKLAHDPQRGSIEIPMISATRSRSVVALRHRPSAGRQKSLGCEHR